MRPALRAILSLWVVCAVALGGVSWVSGSETRPQTLTDTLGDAPPTSPRPEFRVVPVEAGPPPPAVRLQRRLAALATVIEKRRPAAPGLVEFDVVGLNAAVDGILAGVRDQAEVSVHVRDLQTQHVLFDYYGDTPLNPASNQKLLTTSAAIDLLGSDYVFHTKVLRQGSSLFVVGTGDPTLTVDDLAVVAQRVAAQVQLGEIDRLVVDDTAFSPRRFGPGYSNEGPGYAYQAPSGALSLNFNTVEITVQPVRGRRSVAVSVFPESAHVVVDSSARAGRRNTLSVTTRPQDGRTWVEIEGRVPRGSRPLTIRRRVVDPGRFAGATFARLLAEMTATEALPVERGPVPEAAETVHVHESDPLIDVIDAGLAYSNNFMAEQILRTLAWRMTGAPGSWDDGVKVLRGYWSALGNDPDSIVLENASGLSAAGRVTTSGLVDVISVAHRVHEAGQGLIDALPVAGEPGTLQTRLRLSGKRIRAKTGTLEGVSGLSGVVTREDGTPQIAFSILINARDADRLEARIRRRVEDRVVLSLLQFLDDYEARRSGLAAAG